MKSITFGTQLLLLIMAKLAIQKITLQNFKNYKHREFSFSNLHNAIVGRNGVGKTNLLDAVHFLSLTKSAFHNDKQLILQNQDFLRIDSLWQKNHCQHKLTALYSIADGKRFILDDYAFPTLSGYLGHFPAILIAPNDSTLITEGSYERRRFVDIFLCQVDKLYLKSLAQYNQLLRQRNALLQKSFPNKANLKLLEVYDEQLLPLNKQITLQREHFAKAINPILQKSYIEIAQTDALVTIFYQTQCLQDDFEENFKKNLSQDITLQRTTMGIHKDDFLFLLNEKPIKKFGSQGEQKTFLIALKIAVFELLKGKLGVTPILLLDDILDKLDETRSFSLLKKVTREPFGQVLLTEANLKRIEQVSLEDSWHIIQLG